MESSPHGILCSTSVPCQLWQLITDAGEWTNPELSCACCGKDTAVCKRCTHTRACVHMHTHTHWVQSDSPMQQSLECDEVADSIGGCINGEESEPVDADQQTHSSEIEGVLDIALTRICLKIGGGDVDTFHTGSLRV